jgi:hypothetical protein
MRRFSPLLVSLALAGCASAEKITTTRIEVAKPLTLNARQVAGVRVGVGKSLKNHDLEVVNVGRMLAGRISTGVVVCGYVSSKRASGEPVAEAPFHGVFMGLDNASGFVVTGLGGSAEDNAATLEDCRRSGLDLTAS